MVWGYQLDFNSHPPLRRPIRAHLALARDQTQAMEAEIESLLEKQAIVRLTPPLSPGFYSSVFVVPKKDGGWRPIINLKELNRYVISPHFKMENISNLKDVILPRDWMCKIDLKDAYLSVPMHRSNWKFLRFSWKEEYYQFQTLPFGLTSAPYVFTKLLRPVAALFRQEGLRILVYLDDCRGGSRGGGMGGPSPPLRD